MPDLGLHSLQVHIQKRLSPRPPSPVMRVMVSGCPDQNPGFAQPHLNPVLNLATRHFLRFASDWRRRYKGKNTYVQGCLSTTKSRGIILNVRIIRRRQTCKGVVQVRDEYHQLLADPLFEPST